MNHLENDKTDLKMSINNLRVLVEAFGLVWACSFIFCKAPLMYYDEIDKTTKFSLKTLV